MNRAFDTRYENTFRLASKSDPFERLGVSRGVTTTEMNRAYRSLAILTHPDKAPDHLKERCAAAFKQFTDAYEIVTDSDKLRAHDATASTQNEPSQAEATASDFSPRYRRDYGASGELVDIDETISELFDNQQFNIAVQLIERYQLSIPRTVDIIENKIINILENRYRYQNYQFLVKPLSQFPRAFDDRPNIHRAASERIQWCIANDYFNDAVLICNDFRPCLTAFMQAVTQRITDMKPTLKDALAFDTICRIVAPLKEQLMAKPIVAKSVVSLLSDFVRNKEYRNAVLVTNAGSGTLVSDYLRILELHLIDHLCNDSLKASNYRQALETLGPNQKAFTHRPAIKAAVFTLAKERYLNASRDLALGLLADFELSSEFDFKEFRKALLDLVDRALSSSESRKRLARYLPTAEELSDETLRTKLSAVSIVEYKAGNWRRAKRLIRHFKVDALWVESHAETYITNSLCDQDTSALAEKSLACKNLSRALPRTIVRSREMKQLAYTAYQRLKAEGFTDGAHLLRSTFGIGLFYQLFRFVRGTSD